MLPTYVFGWPTGNEKGSYLAVDLGGTNLRVCHVELEGEGRFEVTQTKFRLYVLQTRIDIGAFLFGVTQTHCSGLQDRGAEAGRRARPL
jgi:hexokinase